jgi:hypothetical protein
MTDKDKLAKYRTEIQQVSSIIFQSIPVNFHMSSRYLKLKRGELAGRHPDMLLSAARPHGSIARSGDSLHMRILKIRAVILSSNFVLDV